MPSPLSVYYYDSALCNYTAPYTEGLLSLHVAVEEPIKLALCSILRHLCDCQVQHRVESTIAFAARYVDSLQRDQRERYERTFAKKPKEFRSPPKKQVYTMKAVPYRTLGTDCASLLAPVLWGVVSIAMH